MKKQTRIKVVATLMTVILAFFMPKDVHAEDGKVPPKYYKEMVEGIDYNPARINDCSWSMRNTFSYEKDLIEYNLSETRFESEYVLITSELWLGVNAVAEEYNRIVLVSDLWNISEETLNPASDMTMAVFVPYWSDDAEAVDHIEDVVWDEILNYWSDSTVVIIYLDGFTDEDSNKKRID